MITDHGRCTGAPPRLPGGGPRRRRPVGDRARVLAALRVGRLPVGAAPAGPVGGGLVPREGPPPAGGGRGRRAGGRPGDVAGPEVLRGTGEVLGDRDPPRPRGAGAWGGHRGAAAPGGAPVLHHA